MLGTAARQMGQTRKSCVLDFTQVCKQSLSKLCPHGSTTGSMSTCLHTICQHKQYVPGLEVKPFSNRIQSAGNTVHWKNKVKLLLANISKGKQVRIPVDTRYLVADGTTPVCVRRGLAFALGTRACLGSLLQCVTLRCGLRNKGLTPSN